MIVGVAAIADIFQVSQWTVRRGLREGRRPYTDGYLGKIGERHIWNLHDVFVELGLVCEVCGDPAGPTRLCEEHADMFVRAWDRSNRSRRSLVQFIAICRWVVARYEHVGPIWYTNIWDRTCVVPGCDGEANVGCLGPLCTECQTQLNRSAFPWAPP